MEKHFVFPDNKSLLQVLTQEYRMELIYYPLWLQLSPIGKFRLLSIK